MTLELLTPDMPDSETESLIVHSNGDANMDDLLSEAEFETDVEIENADGVIIEYRNVHSDSSSLNLEPRAKTRLLSRSHSADDLNTHQDTLSLNGLVTEPPRRNSSGEYPSKTLENQVPVSKPCANASLQDIEMPKYKYNPLHRNSLSPSSVRQSPISMQYASQMNWKNNQTAQDKDDEFSILLQTTAERVLNRLKTRQQDLGSNLSIGGQKYQRRPSQCLQPHVPRKLQPITRDGSRTPRSECDLKSVCSDTDLGPLSAA